VSENYTEKRAHTRVPYGAWVTVQQGSEKSFCLARDLSLGGVFLRTETIPEIGVRVDLVLVIEGQRDAITLRGEVVRHSLDEGGYGIKFNEMNDLAAAQLLDLVQEIARQRG